MKDLKSIESHVLSLCNELDSELESLLAAYEEQAEGAFVTGDDAGGRGFEHMAQLAESALASWKMCGGLHDLIDQLI